MLFFLKLGTFSQTIFTTPLTTVTPYALHPISIQSPSNRIPFPLKRMSSAEEIWASRLQRELLALTTEKEHSGRIHHSPSSTGSSQEDSNPNRLSSSTTANPIGILPPFCQWHESKLDLEHGFCQVSFWIQVPSASIPNSNTEQTHTDNFDSSLAGPVILFTLDASLHRNQRSGSFQPSDSYPFQPPMCILQQGAEYFNFSSTIHHDAVANTSTTDITAPWIQNGDELLLTDCDWTPSLHLNDALLHMALLIRESIQRKESSILKVKHKQSILGNITTNTTESMIGNSLLDEVAQDWNKASHKISGFFSNLKQKAAHFAEELDSTFENHVIPSEGGGGSTSMGTTTSASTQSFSSSLRPSPLITEEDVTMGDTIDLSEAPWNHAVGMYPCKVIHRPRFLTIAMKTKRSLEDYQDDHNNNQVSTLSDLQKEEDVDHHEYRRVESIESYHPYADCIRPDQYLQLHSGGWREVGGLQSYLVEHD